MIPDKIRVKLVSEAAEYVSVTHVVQRDFTLPELVEVMLPVIGRDAARIRQMLQVGTVSTGEYRYRWQGLEVAHEELEQVLSAFPAPEPSRDFNADACFAVRFRRGFEKLDLPRESGERKALFARQSFWSGLMELARGARYAAYSYADRADIYARGVDAEMRERLALIAPLLKAKGAAERLQRFQPETIEWLVRR